MRRFLVLALTISAATSPTFAAPIILDTDLGDDIDDTWALCMLLGLPAADVRLITTSAGDTAAKTRLVAKMLERLDRTDIPLGTGIGSKTGNMNQSTWLADYDLAQYKGTVHPDGVNALIDVVRTSTEQVTIVVLGPQMNLKAALERAPDIAQKARVVAMAGSIYVGYNGKEGRQPEWNVVCDVPAAQAVFAAPWEITLAPLDLCGTLTLSGEPYRRIAQSASPLAQVVMENYAIWVNRAGYAAEASSVLFDTTAIYLAIDDDYCEMEILTLRVDDDGNTVPDANGRPVRCALRWKDRPSFEIMLVSAITRE